MGLKMEEIKITSKTEQTTKEIGQKLARQAKRGDCFALYGTLGMGKSVLARAFVQELCGNEEVPSPTFTLVQLYDAPEYTIYHFDLYRLKSAEEIFELGMEDALYDGVCLIEWPEKMAQYLPRNCIKVTITPNNDERIITINSNDEQKLIRMKEALGLNA